MVIDAPSSILAMAGTDEEFTVDVDNVGFTMLHFVRLQVQSDVPAYVSPSEADMHVGDAQEFKVILDIPEGATGTYYIGLKAVSYETVSNAKTVELSIEGKPVVEVVKIELPDLYFNKTVQALVTLRNSGKKEADVDETAAFPEGWDYDTDFLAFTILPSSENTVSFSFTPIESGNIEFTTAYASGDDYISFTNGTYATVKEREDGTVSGGGQSITGMIISIISEPTVYIPASLVSASLVIAALALRKGFMHFPFMRRGKLRSPSAYEKWETKNR
jgi:hypothetical protein